MALIKRLPPVAAPQPAAALAAVPDPAPAPVQKAPRSLFAKAQAIAEATASATPMAPTVTAPKLKFTDEQEAAIACNDDLIIVNAGAGTGKTSMLVGYTYARPNTKFLYAAFSKALQMEAESRFGRNTDCKTTHSMGWGIGSRYQSANKLAFNIRPLDIAGPLSLSYKDAKGVLDTLQNFYASASDEIDEFHVPEDVTLGIARSRSIIGARQCWEMMKDLSNPMPIVHDAYLKLYAMSKPDLSSRYQVILFDEAQDANPVTSQIIMSQKKCKILMVGDRYQSIFGFRGAENAMEEAQEHANSVFYLTKSFRFGKGIAGLATVLLRDFRGASMRLHGLGPVQETAWTVDRSKQHAILSRTNGGIFQRAVQCVRSDTPFSLVTGVQNYQFDKILDVYNLWAENFGEIRDSFIRRFPCFSDASSYAEEVEDKELRSMIKIVEEYRKDVPGLVAEIKQKAIPDAQSDRALVLMTTAHRSKGLEFDQVILDDDYSELLDEDGRPIAVENRQDREEVHLAYVAVTRARAAIELNPQIEDYLAWREQHVKAEKEAKRPAVAMEM